jgi:hypothetical protein
MESNVISFRTHRPQTAAVVQPCSFQLASTQAQAEPQPVAPTDNLIRMMRALIVRLRDGRFNQRAAVYRELDAIARSIERESGVSPGTWV